MITKTNIWKLPIFLLFWWITYGCSDESNPIIPDSSNNLVELNKLINLETYPPSKAKWTFSKMGNQSESRTPGPNDYKLQAVLEFDYDVIKKLKENYKYLSTTISELHKDQFRFKWLDKKNLKKLNNKKNAIHSILALKNHQ